MDIEKVKSVVESTNEINNLCMRLLRCIHQGDACFGYLEIWSETVLVPLKAFYTLENEKKLIPTGSFTFTFSESPKFSKLEPYKECGGLVPDIRVRGRSGIRIHVGNHANETSGCILVGNILNPSGVLSSRDAYRQMMSLFRAYVDPLAMFTGRIHIIDISDEY